MTRKSASEIVLISDPSVRVIAVQECGEPLVDLRGTLLVDTRRADEHGHFAHTRQGVAERLIQADRALPKGDQAPDRRGLPATEPATWSIFDAYRREELQRLTPGLTDMEADTLASRYVSPLEVAPHVRVALLVDLTPRRCGRRGTRPRLPGSRNPGAERRRLLHRRAQHQQGGPRQPGHAW